MALIFRYFALIAAAVSAGNWIWAERQLTLRGAGRTPSPLCRRVLRAFYAEMIVFFLVIGALQWLGGYSDPLFPFYERLNSNYSILAWATTFLLWLTSLIALWRPGVAEAMVEAQLYGGPNMAATNVRVLASAALALNVIVFGSLLAGVWGPIPRPSF